MLAVRTIRSSLRSFRPTSLRTITRTRDLANKQVPESMWTTHPPPPPSVAPSDRIARLPTETESDRQVLESLQSLDQYVRELYDEHVKTSGPILRGTDEVRFGRKYMGMVAMPDYIETSIARLVDKADKKQLRHDYLRIADALRSTGQITPDGKGRGRAAQQQRREKKMSPEELKEEDDALDMNKYPKPLPGERVEVVVSGERPKAESLLKPGTPLTPHTIEYGARESIAYLASSSPATYGVVFNVLTEIADRLPGFRPDSVLDFGCGPGTVLWAAQEVWPRLGKYRGIDVSEDMLKCAEALLEKVPEENRAKKIDFVRYLAPHTEARQQSALVVSAFALSELPSDSVRRTTVENLWSQTSDTLVLIDRGTPDSARMIADARAQLLDLGGVHTFAPLPHDQPDPTANAQTWLHFSQRAQRPTFMMRVKRAKSNIEDLKYSYVVVRRGSRPVAEPVEQQETVSLEVAQQSPERYLPNGVARKTPERLSAESHTWPRVLLPPLKRKGHVIVDVCTFQGNVERWTFTKSHDKQAYRDARKANWGDLFPHEPKSAVVRPGFMPLPDKDDAKAKTEQKQSKTYRVTSVLDK